MSSRAESLFQKPGFSKKPGFFLAQKPGKKPGFSKKPGFWNRL